MDILIGENSLYFLYNLLLPLLIILLSPFILIKIISDKSWRKDFWQRFFIGQSISSGLANDSPIWFHAASVGEVNASVKLLSEIRKRWPGQKLVVSTFTPTGKEAAKEKLGADAAFFLPLDLPFAVKGTIKRINPKIVILMETEIWPNLIRQCGVRQIPLVIVNGRISDKSFGKYGLVRPLLREVFCFVSLILTQSEESKNRFESLGAEGDRVIATGNLKFDMQIKGKPVGAIESWGGPVFIAGSTRDEEEEKVIAAYLKAREKHDNLKLVLAPRHLHRTAEVEQLLSEKGLPFEKFSQLKESISEDVLLVDTLGELSSLYFYGDIVFVGGSLVPLGGQNMLEPALCGKPVLFGPSVENFREAARILTEGGGALMVANSDELGEALIKLLDDPSLTLSMGARAKASVENHTGATEKTINALARFLG